LVTHRGGKREVLRREAVAAATKYRQLGILELVSAVSSYWPRGCAG
jgi:hypothetical protein